MTKETLQVELDKKNIKAKILHVEKTDYKDYEVIFTRDLNYSRPKSKLSKHDVIIEPEEDVLVDDLTDAVLEIKRILSKRAWYEEA